MAPHSWKTNVTSFLIFFLFAATPLRSSRVKFTDSSTLQSEGEFSAPALEDFAKGDKLGDGGYGEVFKAGLKRENGSVETYNLAIKEVERGNYSDVEGHVMSLNLPFVADIEHTFKSKRVVSLVTRLYEGGDVFAHLVVEKSLRNDFLKSWGAQMAYGLWQLHRNKILYGDLKLENTFIVDKSLKQVVLSDFGLAIRSCFAKACTNMARGSLAYVTPSILQGRSHGFEVDWWAHAVSMFTLAKGHFPFPEYDEDRLDKKLIADMRDGDKHIKTLNITHPKLFPYVSRLLGTGNLKDFETDEARLRMVRRPSAHPFLRDSFWHSYDPETEADKIDNFWYDLCMKFAVHKEKCVPPEESDTPDDILIARASWCSLFGGCR